MNGKCSEANTKPAVISNRIQFEKFKPKFGNYNDGNEVWLGLRLTSQGIIYTVKSILVTNDADEDCFVAKIASLFCYCIFKEFMVTTVKNTQSQHITRNFPLNMMDMLIIVTSFYLELEVLHSIDVATKISILSEAFRKKNDNFVARVFI